MKIHNREYLKTRRKELRNNSTNAEIVFWINVKKKQLDGRKFRRQHSIGDYIVDFYCPLEKLAIELDGEQHFNNEEVIEYDVKRTQYLNNLGIRVLRFENNEVLYNIDRVFNEIKKRFKT